MLKLLVVLALPATLAQAQPAAAESPESQVSVLRVRLSPLGASLLSVGATAGLVGGALATRQPEGTDGRTAVLIVAGALLGPSVGNLVVGNESDALMGLGLRVLGGGIGLVGLGSGFMNDGSQVGPAVLLIVGGAVALAGVAHDVVTAGRHVARVQVVPTADLGSGGAGAVVRIAF